MNLPDDVLAIIKDFSKPITRPDWRTLHKMTSYSFHSAILNKYNKRRFPCVIYKFVREYSRCPQDIFKYIFNYGCMDWERRIIMVHLTLK
jgi:hypothetical protein